MSGKEVYVVWVIWEGSADVAIRGVFSNPEAALRRAQDECRIDRDKALSDLKEQGETWAFEWHGDMELTLTIKRLPLDGAVS